MPTEDLIHYICKKGHNRFPEPDKTVFLLQQTVRNSYRLDKCLYESLTVFITSSFALISTYETEIKAVNKTIEKTLKGIDPAAYQSLLSIPGFGPVMTAGILSEIGYIDEFKSQEALAKYTDFV